MSDYDVGLELNVESTGDGPPLLLLHGFTGSAAGWGTLAAAWAPFFTTLAVDLPGHGRSASPANVAAYTMAATVAAPALPWQAWLPTTAAPDSGSPARAPQEQHPWPSSTSPASSPT